MQPAKEVRVPDNQLHLTDAALDEEIAKMLTANNPVAPKALVRFIQKERAYKPEAIIMQTVTHFATDGWLLHRDSEDARKQLEQQRVEEDLQKRFMNEVEKAAVNGAGGTSLSWGTIGSSLIEIKGCACTHGSTLQR
jgi:dynein intermediate chain 1